MNRNKYIPLILPLLLSKTENLIAPLSIAQSNAYDCAVMAFYAVQIATKYYRRIIGNAPRNRKWIWRHDTQFYVLNITRTKQTWCQLNFSAYWKVFAVWLSKIQLKKNSIKIRILSWVITKLCHVHHIIAFSAARASSFHAQSNIHAMFGLALFPIEHATHKNPG